MPYGEAMEASQRNCGEQDRKRRQVVQEKGGLAWVVREGWQGTNPRHPQKVGIIWFLGDWPPGARRINSTNVVGLILLHKQRGNQDRSVFCSCCCSVAQSCLTLFNPMDCSTPGFPVLHHLLELAETQPLLSFPNLLAY